MRATPSLANIIVGVIAAGIFVARLVAPHMSLPAIGQVGPVMAESGHGHKADRLPLFRPAGPSVTMTAHLTLHSAASRNNTTVVAKNVVVHSMDAARSFENTERARDARPVSVVVVKPAARPAGDWSTYGQQRRIADRHDWSATTRRAAPTSSP